MQSAQTPLAPHSLIAVPPTQVPPVDAEQHPPLHAWVEEHAVVHKPVVTSQASRAGQSLATAQPRALESTPTSAASVASAAASSASSPAPAVSSESDDTSTMPASLVSSPVPPSDLAWPALEQVPTLHASPALQAVPLQQASPQPPQLAVLSWTLPSFPDEPGLLLFEPPQLTVRLAAMAQPAILNSLGFMRQPSLLRCMRAYVVRDPPSTVNCQAW
jgi:hypothetical protein